MLRMVKTLNPTYINNNITNILDYIKNAEDIIYYRDIFKCGDVIPEWVNYKYHLLLLVISTRADVVTHMQILLFGLNYVRYNNNHMTNMNTGISLNVIDDGTIIVNPEYQYKDATLIKNVTMWGRKKKTIINLISNFLSNLNKKLVVLC